MEKKRRSAGSSRMKELGYRGVMLYITEEEYLSACELSGDKPVATWAAEKLKKIIKKHLTVPRTKGIVDCVKPINQNERET